ncbi:Ketimine reductase mu-crystallin [Pseudolycoriella hygida]|uniref:Ketimine reductase mu-crystallin n=1 Tax=Pseudolycoriella hygida TaxID=35572 RepID=A0A9Q0N095_9DIPT|nr:Ketimine reductase mu-crystallin [Pseudolycoriella hygida]
MCENRPTFITEAQVEELLTWPAVYEASEQALQSICEKRTSDSQPSAKQPPRPFVELERRNGLAFSMLGYIENYRMQSVDQGKVFDTLAHKIVTAFTKNGQLAKPLPVIIATVFLFDTMTGQLKTIVEGNGVTAWRTAGSCMVGTKYLYFDRNEKCKSDKVLGILGCGVQGRIHAIGISTMFPISEIHLWNRSVAKAAELKKELESLAGTFKSKHVKIFIHENVRDCVKTADIIVTATQSTSPILFEDMVKENVHINAVGASKDHHSEIDLKLYRNSKLYVDSWTGGKTELKSLDCPIEAEVGEIITKSKALTQNQRTIFHSLGMAVTDAVVAQIAETLYLKKKSTF